MTNETPALGICLEEYEYPYPVQFLTLGNDLQPLKMAYMDVPPGEKPNGKTVVLFHGKAFGCYYFRSVIEALTESGYRVVAPDQIGWGKSPKPEPVTIKGSSKITRGVPSRPSASPVTVFTASVIVDICPRFPGGKCPR